MASNNSCTPGSGSLVANGRFPIANVISPIPLRNGARLDALEPQHAFELAAAGVCFQLALNDARVASDADAETFADVLPLVGPAFQEDGDGFAALIPRELAPGDSFPCEDEVGSQSSRY